MFKGFVGYHATSVGECILSYTPEYDYHQLCAHFLIHSHVRYTEFSCISSRFAFVICLLAFGGSNYDDPATVFNAIVTRKVRRED